MGGRRSFDGRDRAGALGRREVHVVPVREKLVPVMRTREPEHVSEPLVNVLRSIERAYCAAHGLTVDDIDAETPDEDAPCGNRSRDPPTGNCA